jgi:flagellar biogenesis protein FliO
MQLKYNRQQSFSSSLGKILIKLFLALLLIIVAIFLIEKINFPIPEQKYKIDITDEIKKLK